MADQGRHIENDYVQAIEVWDKLVPLHQEIKHVLRVGKDLTNMLTKSKLTSPTDYNRIFTLERYVKIRIAHPNNRVFGSCATTIHSSVFGYGNNNRVDARRWSNIKWLIDSPQPF